MKLAKFSVGQILSIGLAATVFIIFVHFLGRRGVPVFEAASKALRGG